MDYICAECKHLQDAMNRLCDKCGSVRVVSIDALVALLEPIQLPSNPRLAALLEEPFAILDRAYMAHQPSLIVGMLSGGYDSATTTHVVAAWASARGLPFKVAHINTGTGVKEALLYVRDLCASFGWELLEYNARENVKADGMPDPQNYEDLVLAHGFPGPWAHRKMYSQLKERQIERIVREHKQSRKDCILLASGKRLQESARRMRTTQLDFERDGATLWANPIRHWSKDDVLDYKELVSIPNSIVVDTIHRSGECNCGAYAQPGELAELEMWFPETGCWLRDLERRVKEAGFPWGWEDAPPEWWGKILDMTADRWAAMTRREQLHALKGQSNMWEAFQELGNSPLCSTCDARWAELQEAA